jgi:hypothetical protein
MEVADRIARRLALFEGVEFPASDLELIAAEIEDLERIIGELERFSQTTPWISLQAQPSSPKV